MPKIPNSQKSVSTLNNDQRLNFRERLEKRFKAHEYIRVINVDDEPFDWLYMPESSEEETFSADGMHREIYRGEPEHWMINPGESEVIQGGNAYVMIDGLYKKLVAKKKLAQVGEYVPGTPGRNFNFSDTQAQEEWIDKIYLGKESPMFTQVKEVKDVKPVGARTPKME